MAKRKNKGGAQTKPGAPDHFVGFKKQFLDAKAVAYQQSLDTKKISEFYDKVTRDFVAKFGDEIDVTKDPAEDPPDPDSDSAPVEFLSQQAADDAAKRFQKLRTVSGIL